MATQDGGVEARLRHHFVGQETVPTGLTIESTTEQVYTQDRGLNTARTVAFEVEAHDDTLIDLQECFLTTKIRVVKANGDPIPPMDEADPSTLPNVFLPVNYGNALWGQVSIRLNGQPLPPGNDYTYTGVLIDYLGAAPVVREQVLKPVDGTRAPTHHSSYLPHAFHFRDNLYFNARLGVAGSPTIEVHQRIHSDFLMTASHLLPSGMRLSITLQRNKDDFLLCRRPGETEAYRVEMREVSLSVKRVRPNPTARALLDRSLASGGQLVYQRLHLIPFPCPRQSKIFTHYNCFNGVVPRRVFVAIVTQDSYEGSYDRDPTFLENANVSRLRVCRNGQEVMPVPYTSTWSFLEDTMGCVDTENSHARGPFNGLNRVLEGAHNPRQLPAGVSYRSYLMGATIWGVNLAHADSVKPVSGALDLHVEFATPVQESMMILVLGEYPITLRFDGQRNLYAGP